MSGRLGLGGHFEFGPVLRALSVKYWVSDLGLQALFSMDTRHSTADEDGYLIVRPEIRLVYAMTRTHATNFLFLAGLASTFERRAGGGGNRGFLNVGVGVEHFLGDRFAVGSEAALIIELNDEPLRIVTSTAWGFSFHLYF
jgi:hypothetical protein